MGRLVHCAAARSERARAEAPTLLARPAYTRPLANEWLTGAVASAVGATSKASAGTRVITLGVGSISVEQDGTSASFDLARYLRERPLRTACGEVTVRLIDYPTEADYSVAGRVTGAIRHAYSSPQSEYAGALASI